ncbi:MAG TPA: hypothetical protein VMU41_06555 [Candidatus Binataceae bacterium]|nr:hypothetical protein [Candidatus Binataceae bacterium]
MKPSALALVSASGSGALANRTQPLREPAQFPSASERGSFHSIPPAKTSVTRLERPSLLQELVDLIGQDAAAKLVDIFGGTRLYIPHSPQDDDLLTESLGAEAALKLARIYGGDRIEVPNPTPRRARILELRETGCSIDAIARNLGCTRRRVFQVLAEARAAKRSA